jgi:hypothetical protein
MGRPGRAVGNRRPAEDGAHRAIRELDLDFYNLPVREPILPGMRKPVKAVP